MTTKMRINRGWFKQFDLTVADRLFAACGRPFGDFPHRSPRPIPGHGRRGNCVQCAKLFRVEGQKALSSFHISSAL
jgi:hypothetical protein